MSIKPYHKNAKKHPDKQLKLIAKSLKEFGWQQPIVVDKNDVIIVGHGRWAAYEKYPEGIKEPWIRKEDTLTSEQVKAYRLADNKLNESDWDMDLAIEDLKGLSPEMFDLTGFDADLLIEPEDKDDEIPENPPAIAKLGDIYQLGEHRVMCGDSTKIEDVEKLMDGKKADMVFTDPPYNINVKSITFKTKILNDNLPDFKEFLNDILTVVWTFSNGSKYICFDIREKSFIEEFYNRKIKSLIVWGKDIAQHHRENYGVKYELIAYFEEGDFYGKNEENLWSIKSIQSAGSIDENGDKWFAGGSKNLSLHPTQKPIELISRAINNSSKADDIVMDLFLGSGSTLIACEKTNRVCFGMELDPKYIDVIIERWEKFTGEKAKKL